MLLHGDWLIVMVSDGIHVGLGEATHNGNDARCINTITELFDRHVASMDLSLEGIRMLEEGPFARIPDFLTGTAVSGINQALYDLLARQQGVPVWRLFTERPVHTHLPFYVTINRALTTRTADDYRSIVTEARHRGYRHIKCAPFEKVTADSDQLAASRDGLTTLTMLRREFPDMGIRVDFHKRFTCENFLAILPELETLSLDWIEEPIKIGPLYRTIRSHTSLPIAAGELFSRPEEFTDIMKNKWADVVMPDVKHVGGFGPLIGACRLAETYEISVSPHNPSGPVSTIASLHAAALSKNVTSLEIPFPTDRSRMTLPHLIEGSSYRMPEAAGWGIAEHDLPSQV
jgi:galactonate dehydratase